MKLINNRTRPFPFSPKGSEGNGKFDYTIIESGEPIAMGRKARRLTERVERIRARAAETPTGKKKRKKRK